MGFPHKAEKLLFSVPPSIITFVGDLILGSFLAFCGPHGLFWESWEAQKSLLGPLINVVEQLFLSMFPSILTFYLTLFWGCFCFFGP